MFAFEGCGTQSTLQRFHEQKKLMNNALIVIEHTNSNDIASDILAHNEAPSDSKSSQKSDAAKAIIQDIVKQYNAT